MADETPVRPRCRFDAEQNCIEYRYGDDRVHELRFEDVLEGGPQALLLWTLTWQMHEQAVLARKAHSATAAIEALQDPKRMAQYVHAMVQRYQQGGA